LRSTGVDSELLGFLQRYAAAYFYGLEVELLPPISEKSAAFKELGRRSGWPGEHGKGGVQINANTVCQLLIRRLPSDAYCMAALTNYDIWNSNYNFLYGLAKIQQRVGLFSFARYDPAFEGLPREGAWASELRWRASMVMCHELTHMMGVLHCVYYNCRMQGCNSMEEADGRPADL